MITEYQKITDLLGNKFTQQFKLKTKNLAEITDNARGMFNTNS